MTEMIGNYERRNMENEKMLSRYLKRSELNAGGT